MKEILTLRDRRNWQYKLASDWYSGSWI